MPKAALSTYIDWRRYERLPERGGLYDQPFEWKQQLDTVLEAKEWVEAIRNAESQLEQAQDAVDSSDEASDGQLKSLEKAGTHYEEVTASHKERLVALRSWWRGEPWVDQEEERKRREEEEFKRYIESL